MTQSDTKDKELRQVHWDYVDGIVRVLSDYNRDKDKGLRPNVNAILDDDSAEIGKFPVISVFCTGHTEQVLSLGSVSKKVLMTYQAQIWYYNEKITGAIKRKDIYFALSTISAIMRENPTVGGFAHDTRILASWLKPKIVNGTLVSGGVVIIESDKIIRQSNV